MHIHHAQNTQSWTHTYAECCDHTLHSLFQPRVCRCACVCVSVCVCVCVCVSVPILLCTENTKQCISYSFHMNHIFMHAQWARSALACAYTVWVYVLYVCVCVCVCVFVCVSHNAVHLQSSALCSLHLV